MTACPCGSVDCQQSMTVVLVIRTPEERHALTRGRVSGAFTTDMAFLSVAVWKLLRHLDVPMPADAFALPYTVPTVAEELAQEPEQTPLFGDEGDLL